MPFWPTIHRLFRLRRSVDADVDDELRFHIDARADELAAAGAEPDAARAQAAREFGDFERFTGACREIGRAHERETRRAEMLDGLRQDVTYALRTLRRAPGFTAVAVLTLALGVGATTAIFSVVSALLLRPLPYEGADRVVLLTERPRGDARAMTTTSWPNVRDWREMARSFESIAIVDGWSPTLTGLGDAERLKASYVTAELFDVLRLRPQLGRPMLPSDNVPNAELVAVVSDGFWRRRLGGDPGVVGRRITLNGQPRTVVGVLPASYRGFDELDGELFANIWFDSTDGRTARYLRAVARLRPGVTVEQARAEMRAVHERLAAAYPQEDGNQEAIVTPLRDNLVRDSRTALLLLFTASALVLLIACANVANLLLARGLARARELAVRAALGAGRARTVRQLLTESLVLAAAGGGAGLALAVWGTHALLALAPEQVLRSQEVSVDWRVLAFGAAVTLATGLLFGLAPAVRATRVDLQSALKAGGRGGASIDQGSTRARGALAVAQLGLALALLSGAALLMKSFARLHEVDPGFRPDGLLSASLNLPYATYRDEKPALFYERLAERVRGLPGVRAAAVSSTMPFSGNWDRIGVGVEGHRFSTGTEAPEADRYIVSADFFATLGVPLKRGRLFAAADRAGAPPVVVVDELFARRLAALSPTGDAIGMRLGAGHRGADTLATVVGVVGHLKHYGLDAESQGQIYYHHAQYPWRWMSVVARVSPGGDGRADPLALAPAVRRAVHALDPGLAVYDVRTMDQMMAARAAVRRFSLLLLGAFAAVAVLVAAVGLYGVIAYGVSQRRQEIGIRLALGARPRDVVRMVVRQGASLAAAGIAVGVAAALAGSRLIAGMLFGVRAGDPAVLGAVSALLLLVAVAASLIPARRAAGVDPASSLRSD